MGGGSGGEDGGDEGGAGDRGWGDLSPHQSHHIVNTCTVTRRTVKFPYIHMMTPDDNGPRRENISRMRAG